MSKEWTSLILWTGLFLIFELTAVFWAACPWYTLSRTVWNGEAWYPPVALFVAVFVLILLGHLELHWSVRWLLAATAVGVALIVSHLIERAVTH